jgi:pimeloyl-ACP methyl ester carboxylesterase
MTLAYSPPVPRIEFGELPLSTGIRLSCAEQGDPNGDAVILLHGYSDSWFSFSRILPLLDARYHAYALDLRGHGNSDRPAHGYALHELAADVLAFLDARRLDRVSVVGHSLGSLVAQQVAVCAPDRLERLVLIGSLADPARSPTLNELATLVRAFGDAAPEDFIREFQLGSVHQPMPADFMSRVIAESRKLPVYAWQGVMDGLLSAQPATALASSRIPTLLLWGERDAFFTREDQLELLNMIRSAELKIYPETGHSPHWERSEEVARDIQAFLARTASV